MAGRTPCELLCSFFCSGCSFGHASATEGILQTVIRLMTGVLVDLARYLRDGHFSRPWSGPHPRIFHRELVANGLGVGAGEAFDHMQVLGSRERTHIREIGGVDHQRVPLPMAD